MDKICIVKECGQKAYARGYCRHHYKKVLKYGDAYHETRRFHGMSDTVEHDTWRNIKQRCYNENSDCYMNYGGRGIIVCERWKDSFPNFYEDMGKRPSDRHQIDRIDNNGDYEPTNCHWVTNRDNSQNRRSTVLDIDKAREIREKYSQGVRKYELEKEYGCSSGAIAGVLSNKTWKE